MKKYIILINFFIVFLGQLLAGQYKWDRIEIPYNIAEPGIVAYQNNIYLVGGRNGMSHYAPCSDQIWKYDPQSSNWQEMNGKLPYGMYTRNKCIVSGNKLIVSPSEGPNLQGGYGSHQKIVEYDFTSDIAVETAAYQNIVWYVTFGSFNINGNNRVYSFGGWSSNPLNEIYSYVVDSGTLQLVTTAALCERRGILLIGYDLNGKAYLFGGNSAPHNSVEVFDPVTETISNLGNILPEGLSGEGSFAWTSSTGKIFIARLDPSGKIYIFDPCDKSFTEASFGLPTPTAGFAIDYGTYNSATGSIYVIESKIWDGTDQFDSHIWIGTPATLLLPNGGEEFVSGNTETITWQALDSIENVSIKYSDANGLSWTVIDPNTPNDGSYDWHVPAVNSNKCLVRISSVSDPNIYDTSDNAFTIFVCQLDSVADLNKDCKVDLSDLAIIAMNWLRNGNPLDEGFTETLPIIWVYINDPGVSGHEPFNGQMSKYETTNAQYCQFLNAALASGDIIVDVNDVIGASGSNSGEDFVGEVYYDLAGPGDTDNGATNGGAARINYSGGVFSVDSGFENHPVTYVTWYGATAFCNYYGYKLPTEWEWQAVADYDGNYTYGCGTSINNSIVNQYGSTHPYGTTVVGSFGDPSGYGYGMCDMAGNVHEWTSTDLGGSCIFRGGCWVNIDEYCTVSFRYSSIPGYTDCHYGFRVCR